MMESSFLSLFARPAPKSAGAADTDSVSPMAMTERKRREESNFKHEELSATPLVDLIDKSSRFTC